MLQSFEIKSYNQLRFCLGLANSLFAFLLFLACYELSLADAQRQALVKMLEAMRVHPLLSRISVFLVMSAAWGWLSTVVLRLHDRVHEPWIRKWRAGYDADFILRTLCSVRSANISPDLFERAYTDKRICRKLMQRLFYRFAGDSVSSHEGSRVFFYTVMWKYWTAALCDLYCLVGMLFFALYHTISRSVMSPALMLVLTVMMLVSRLWSNAFLDEAHELSLNQIHAIRTDNAEDLESEMKAVAMELSAWRE